MLRDVLGSPVSDRWRWVHIVVGAVMPAVFLVADPIVFRTQDRLLSVGPVFGDYRALGYTATLLAAMLVIHALVSRPTRTSEAGMLYAAAAVAAALGLARVYFRNAARVHAAVTNPLWSRGARNRNNSSWRSRIEE